MAENSSKEIDLSQAARYVGEANNLRPIDEVFDIYAHNPNPEDRFDICASMVEAKHNARAEDGLFASMHVGAAVGAMILRAEAGLPGAKSAWKQRHSRIEEIMTRKGGVLMSMVSSLGDEIEGAGSIVGLYLATNAADPGPDYSIFTTAPRVTVMDRINQARHKGTTGGNYGAQQGGGEVWNGDRVSEICRGYIQAYLGREQRLRVTDPDAILAGAYGAVMLRSGALARYYATKDPIALRQIEDFISAAARLRRGRGDEAVLSELNPLYTKLYQLGAALMEGAGVKARTSHGAVDGAVQAVRTLRGAFGRTEVRFNKYVPDTPPAAGARREFEEPMSTRAPRGGKVVGGGLPPRTGGAGAPAKKAARPAAGQPASGASGTGGPRMAAGNTPPKGFSPRVREIVRRPLAVMITAASLHTELTQAKTNPRTYPHWAELLAAHKLREAGGNATSEEVTFFGPNDETVTRLALRQLHENGTLEAIERGEAVPPEMYTASLEVRRLLASIANGNRTSKHFTPQEARMLAERLRQAHERQVREAYGVPPHQFMTPALFETLNELNVLRLAGPRVLEQPEEHKGFLQSIIQRIANAMQALNVQDPAMPEGTATTHWRRARNAMRAPGRITANDLPPAAQEQYRKLKHRAVGLFPQGILD